VTFSLRKNLGLRLTALGLALFVWFLVQSEEQVIRDFPVPVTYDIDEQAGVVLTGDRPEQVNVRVTGPATVMSRATLENMIVYVDLREMTRGAKSILLTPARNLRNVPAGCTAEFLDSAPLSLNLEQRLDRQVTVVAAVAGEPPEGYQATTVEITPERVWVTGPASAFNEGDEIRVISDPINLSDLDTDGTEVTHRLAVAAVPDDPAVQLQNPEEFTAIVKLQEMTARWVRQVPVVGFPDTVEVRDDRRTVRIEIEGYPSKMERLLDGLQAEVGSEGLGGEWIARAPRLSREPTELGVELLSIRPAEVQVRAAVSREPETP
jgi:YbbR domain-containing protein